MSKKTYFLLPPKASAALEAFRAKWVGSWPVHGIDWSELDSDRQMVLDEVFGPAERKRLASDRNYQVEYREFLSDLCEGEPSTRIVDPIVVHGSQAGIQCSRLNHHGYSEQVAQRVGEQGSDGDASNET